MRRTLPYVGQGYPRDIDGGVPPPRCSPTGVLDVQPAQSLQWGRRPVLSSAPQISTPILAVLSALNVSSSVAFWPREPISSKRFWRASAASLDGEGPPRTRAGPPFADVVAYVCGDGTSRQNSWLPATTSFLLESHFLSAKQGSSQLWAQHVAASRVSLPQPPILQW